MKMALDIRPKSAEFKALAEWLERDTPLEEIARGRNIHPGEFKKLVSEVYTRCTNAVIAYHSDRTGEFSHGGSAYEFGVDLWVYIYFQNKYGIHHTQSDEGLRHAEKLKENILYTPSLLH
jgi:hypothetical protein